MSANKQTEVLVVGAGPTGLTLAAALARLGVRTRVIDRYEQERLPIARQILRGTDIAFQFALSGNPLIAGLRPMLLPRILGTHWIQRRLATAISQVSAARRKIRERHQLLGDGKVAGARAD
jgi:2-polyprenyl-6-methoxyphenol hydroxylase-like FAD-dependent oxidoreductase